MSKGLVIGAAGFVGSYLIEEMYSCGIDSYATKLPHERLEHERAKVYDLDILSKEAIVTLLLLLSVSLSLTPALSQGERVGHC